MKLTGLEEHFATPEVMAARGRLDAKWQDVAFSHSDTKGDVGDRLAELGNRRLADMDDMGLDVQSPLAENAQRPKS